MVLSHRCVCVACFDAVRCTACLLLQLREAVLRKPVHKARIMGRRYSIHRVYIIVIM
jgi:hypothetical protein